MTKYDLIISLDELPDEIIEAKGLYELGLINKCVMLQHNLYLENKYREYKVHDDGFFIEHKIKGWRVLMETED